MTNSCCDIERIAAASCPSLLMETSRDDFTSDRFRKTVTVSLIFDLQAHVSHLRGDDFVRNRWAMLCVSDSGKRCNPRAKPHKRSQSLTGSDLSVQVPKKVESQELENQYQTWFLDRHHRSRVSATDRADSIAFINLRRIRWMEEGPRITGNG
ncbi:hypothetical protein FPSE_04947 [Fusarium pseudograminearum CS3096]|uniref:Uncharacterized protein n=1 Tax=Fusarium pseudograminearum (strain CS3096) TaxID=1028729 RepID=K3URA1_FUSPC|nr:hypothetical protein FPSE_04947 [Fusarium pseudograminearum CS3096]EKJ74911.1 hypothetical protein FPSE_04947 [Fusarium pseudograminearum CS3096]